MKAVVTGAAGFVGHHLCAALLDDPRVTQVVGVDCFTPYYPENLKRRNLALIKSARFQFKDADLRDCNLQPILDGADLVFHQAGQPGVRASWGETFTEYLTHNVLVTQRLLEAVKAEAGLSKFVYASSSSVYGNAISYPTTEEDLPRPVSPYGVTKLAAEHMCSLYGVNFGVPTVSLRYFTVYGPRQRPDMLFSRLVEAAYGRRELEIFGDGTQVRDFTYVADIAAANIAAAFSQTDAGSVYNVSGGTHVSVREVVALVHDLVGREPWVKFGPRMPGDALRTGGGSKRALDDLGWSPSTSLEAGLRAMLDPHQG